VINEGRWFQVLDATEMKDLLVAKLVSVAGCVMRFGLDERS
jgi:hypothetical protein